MKLTPCILLLLASTAALASNPASSIKALQHELERWAGNQTGAIIAITVEGDTTQLAKAGRWSAKEERLPDVHTAFELGSISKVFTALLTADAVESGKLNWDDAIGGDFAQSPVTYAMLATHTSGLPRLPEDFPFENMEDPYAKLSLADLHHSFQQAIAAAQGKALPDKWSYSNFGFAVLGQAVAAELDHSYPVALRQHVLAPLQLTETWYSGTDNDSANTSRLAPGHHSARVASRWQFDAYGPAGAWVSTAADMERFMRAMLAGNKPWVSTMEPRAETGGADAMGYGWMIRMVEGSPVFWHGGGTGGYRSFIGIQPDTQRGITILAARDVEVADIGLGWFQGILHEPTANSVMETLSLDEFVGDYPLAPQFILAVFQGEQGELRAQATGQPSFALTAQGNDTFAFEGVAARLSFERDAEDQVRALTLHQAGQELHAPRHPLGSLQSKPKGITLTPEQLKGLEGDYELAPTFVITISVSEAQVFAQATGQPRFPIYASGPDEFFYEVVDARITFERNSEGAITQLVLHQNGQDLPGKKR